MKKIQHLEKVFKLILGIVLVSSIDIKTCYSQTENKDFHLGYNYLLDPLKRGKLDYILGYERINSNVLELGVAKGHRGFEGWGAVYANYHISTEHNFKNNHYLLGTILGYKLSILFINVTGHLIYYTDFKNNSFGFRPEIGLTYLGKFDINYGYNFLISDMYQTKGHLLLMRYTIGKGIRE